VTQTELQFDHREDQASRILEFLKAGNRITPIDALNLFGCFRLGGRIYDLKKAGYQIEREMVKLNNGKRVARYRLAVRL
jgi:hypothetical protein